ncbi:hypothetical protein FA13DRAFT_1713251 [Coprinellus micaceus]|uniref:Uncharacterized protein n=1 Tax=Coprinellus micaceus TaxID=71717 RepID=A0A4Y7SX42_COPMI|nr:hypothetical protein FA13DRAFT_1713251 [Coprinellus micaceus]
MCKIERLRTATGRSDQRPVAFFPCANGFSHGRVQNPFSPPRSMSNIHGIMQLGNPVGISLFANPVASPVMAPDPKSGWESADGHKRKERVRQEITIPHFVSTFGNVKYKRRVRGSFTAVLSTLNAPNYKLQPGRLHQVGRAGKSVAPSLLCGVLPSPAAHSRPRPAIAEIPVMGRAGNQACTNILHAKCYGDPGYSAVTGLPNCIIHIHGLALEE